MQNIAVSFNDLVQSYDQPCFQPQKQQLYNLGLLTTFIWSRVCVQPMNGKSNIHRFKPRLKL